MKNISEVIRRKEAELQQLQRDVESLRVAVRLLADDGDTTIPNMARAGAFADAYASTSRAISAPANNDTTYADPWDSAIKKFP